MDDDDVLNGGDLPQGIRGGKRVRSLLNAAGGAIPFVVDADLLKLLIRDSSMSELIRQHRETDGWGNFVCPTAQRDLSSGHGHPRPMKSAFDGEDGYDRTQPGVQFVHYAMAGLPLKLEFKISDFAEAH